MYTFNNFTMLAKDLNMTAKKEWRELLKTLHHGPRKEMEFDDKQKHPLLDGTS